GQDRLTTVDAVAAHAGHDDADHSSLVDPRRRLEQNVNRWLVAADRGIVGKAYPRAGEISGDHHVAAAGGDQDLVGKNKITFGRLLDRQRAGVIEPIREDPGELGDHVLDDQDRRHGRGQERENVAERLRAPRGDSDHKTNPGGWRNGRAGRRWLRGLVRRSFRRGWPGTWR